MSDFNENEMEKYLASTVNYLLQTGDRETALLLAGAQIVSVNLIEYQDNYQSYLNCKVMLRVPPMLQKKYATNSGEDEIRYTIQKAFDAVFAEYRYVELSVGATLVEIDLDWRTKLIAESETGKFLNQNHYAKEPITYKGMSFNSQPEVSIAQALDRAGVMYMPNCLARTGVATNRANQFPDFLICYGKKWGVLEVDGSTFHSTSATKDHDRRRPLEQHGGLTHYDRYDAMRCQREPDKVVAEFLNILGKK